MSLVRSSLCLDVCFSFVELKRGISQDLISSPKLDKYKIARQLTDKAIKVNALWGSGGGVLLRTEICFGIWRVSSLPLTPPCPCEAAPAVLAPAWRLLPVTLCFSCTFEIGNAFKIQKTQTHTR